MFKKCWLKSFRHLLILFLGIGVLGMGMHVFRKQFPLAWGAVSLLEKHFIYGSLPLLLGLHVRTTSRSICTEGFVQNQWSMANWKTETRWPSTWQWCKCCLSGINSEGECFIAYWILTPVVLLHFYWRSRDSKSPHYSSTLLDSHVYFSNANIWMVSILPASWESSQVISNCTYHNYLCIRCTIFPDFSALKLMEHIIHKIYMINFFTATYLE